MKPLFRPAGPHNPLIGPAVCLCVECSRIMLARRCTARSAEGIQCGDYKGHRGSHTQLVVTTFQIAAERTAVSS